jgi:hypothetical protein
MEKRMPATRPAAFAAALLFSLAGGLALTACDERQQRSEGNVDGRGERTVGESRAPDAEPARPQRPAASPQQAPLPQAPSQRAAVPDPGSGPERNSVPDRSSGPEMPPGAGALVTGTWRVRLESGAEKTEGVTYTFTADGRVTVAPKETCRYRLEREVLSIDCAAATTEHARAGSASGPIELLDRNTLVWTVGDKTVRLEEQQ